MMKKKLRASLGTLIAILLTVSLALNAFAAAIGHAVYRDLDSNNDFLRDQVLPEHCVPMLGKHPCHHHSPSRRFFA